MAVACPLAQRKPYQNPLCWRYTVFYRFPLCRMLFPFYSLLQFSLVNLAHCSTIHVYFEGLGGWLCWTESREMEYASTRTVLRFPLLAIS